MPWTSAVRLTASTLSTPVRPLTSSPRVGVVRARKRLVVRLARRIGSPSGTASYEARNAATAPSWSAMVQRVVRVASAGVVRSPREVVGDRRSELEGGRKAGVPHEPGDVEVRVVARPVLPSGTQVETGGRQGVHE